MTCLSLLFPLLLILPVLSPCLSSPMSVLTCCVINVLSLMSRRAYTDLTQNNFVPLLPAHYCMSVFILSKHNCPLFFFFFFFFFVTPFYLFFPYHFSITFLLTFRIFDFFPDQGIAFSIYSYYNLSQVQL